MRRSAIKLSFVGIAAMGVAMVLAAIAVAHSSGDDNRDRSSELPMIVQDTPGPSDATGEPSPAAPDPIDSVTPADVSETERPGTPDTDGPTHGTDGPTADDEGESYADSIEGTTIALNPGGHCVELPNDSDVLRNPDKHKNWVVGSCEPGDVEPPDREGSGEGIGPPEGRTPSLNPEGVCVNMPNNSDIVRNPDKHPDWVVGGCQLSAE